LQHLDSDTDNPTQYHGHNCGSIPLLIAAEVGTEEEAEWNKAHDIDQDIPNVTQPRGKLFPRRCQYLLV
jgi:hypothetical protein